LWRAGHFTEKKKTLSVQKGNRKREGKAGPKLDHAWSGGEKAAITKKNRPRPVKNQVKLKVNKRV